MLTNVLEYLEGSAERFPDKTAYADETTGISFGQLLDGSRRIGTYLARNLAAPGPVIVFLDKSPVTPECFFGILQSGSFYVPMDTAMPKARISLITENLSPAGVLTDAAHSEDAKELFPGVDIFDLENALKTEADDTLLAKIRGAHLDTMPAYVLYTSGSTGVPKGVVVPHRALIDYMEHFCPEVGVKETDVIANQAPFYFDASLIDIYCTLKMGATMYIVPLSYFSMPLQLLSFLDEKKVTMIRWVPSAMNIVSTFKAFKTLKPEALRLVIFGAESMPTKCYNYWHANYPEATFIQIYGPTEITGVCTYYVVDREYEDTQTIPIGKAFGNSGVFLLDEEDRLIGPDQVGVDGEICVKGTCLAHGYYNAPDKTAQVFTQNPLNPNYPELIYRTGDLASYNERGEFVFASRKDFQVKHMGHRIELGEIETAVNSIEGIRSAICLFDGKRSKIILVYVSEGPDDVAIINDLKDRLPRYMIPNVLHRVDEMPLTLSGKADRVKLKETYIRA